MSLRRIFLVLLLLNAACSALQQPTPTSTPTDTPTITPSPTDTSTPTPIPPTDTPSLTPSPTLTPSNTPTFTPMPTATDTPEPVMAFTYENWHSLNLPTDITARLASPMLAFINTNNRTGVSQATPQPGNDIETLYYVSPTSSAGRVQIFQVSSATGRQIFISPNGQSIAYLRPDGGSSIAGLYVADFSVPGGISARLLPLASLTQRGVYSEPSWSPDGKQLALAVATGYAMDIFVVNHDGTNPTDLTKQGSYDFWPVWSPDGHYLAFVSDRTRCPTWVPGQPGTCDGTGTPPPNGGNVFVLEMSTGRLSQASKQWVTEPPRWANPREVVYASGDPLLGDPGRSLWYSDVVSGETREVKLTSNDTPLKLAESWSPDGQEVLFQAAASDTEIVLAQINGEELGRITDLPFTRYSMRAAWSPDGTHIAIGGVSGQCPYGAVVVDGTLTTISRANPPPTMCDPAYSPDGRWLAFTGVTPRIDGRVDVFVTNPNGLGAVNLTGSLRGQIAMLGWVGGQ